MDGKNWKAEEASDWRNEVQQDFREMIVNKMMDKLKSHLPFPGQKGLQELTKIAVRFEEMYYSSATSQSDYLARICLKMVTMETSQNPMSDSPHCTIASGNVKKNLKNQMIGIQQLPPIPAVSHQSQASLFSFDMPQDTSIQNMSTATPNSVGTVAMGIRHKQVVHQEQQPLRNRFLKRKFSEENFKQSILPINLPIIHQQQQLKSRYISDFQKQQMVDIQQGSSRLESYHKPSTCHQSIDTVLQQNRQQTEMQPGFQTSGSLHHLPTNSMIDQQIMLPSRGVSEVALYTSLQAENAYSVDWEDVVIKYLCTDEMYNQGLNEIVQGTSTNLSQENHESSEIEPTNAEGILGTTLHYSLTHNSSCLDVIRDSESNVVEQPLERLIKVELNYDYGRCELHLDLAAHTK